MGNYNIDTNHEVFSTGGGSVRGKSISQSSKLLLNKKPFVFKKLDSKGSVISKGSTKNLSININIITKFIIYDQRRYNL